MIHENDPHEERIIDYSFIKRISWGAIIAGFIIAVVINLTLNLLGVGIGIGAVDPASQDAVPQSLGIGAIIWYLLSIIISLVAGGWVAAHLSGIPERMSGILHGLLTWSLFTIFSFYLLTSAIGGALGVTGRVIGQAASLAGQGAEAFGPQVRNVVQRQFNQSGTPQQFKQEARQIAPDRLENPQRVYQTIDQVFSKDEDQINQNDRRALANVLTTEAGVNQARAQQVAGRWIQEYQQTQQEMDNISQDTEKQAREVAQDVSSVLSTAAIAAFIGLVIGAASGAVGGAMGKPSEAREVIPPRSRDRDNV